MTKLGAQAFATYTMPVRGDTAGHVDRNVEKHDIVELGVDPTSRTALGRLTRKTCLDS